MKMILTFLYVYTSDLHVLHDKLIFVEGYYISDLTNTIKLYNRLKLIYYLLFKLITVRVNSVDILSYLDVFGD